MAETGVAAAVLRQLRTPSGMAGFYGQARWEQVFAHLEERHGVRLTERQRQALPDDARTAYQHVHLFHGLSL